MDLTKTQIVEVFGMFILIFILIFVLALLTPRLAKFCDKFIGKFFKKSNDGGANEIYKVKSIYDAPTKNISDENNKDGEEKNGEE